MNTSVTMICSVFVLDITKWIPKYWSYRFSFRSDWEKISSLSHLGPYCITTRQKLLKAPIKHWHPQAAIVEISWDRCSVIPSEARKAESQNLSTKKWITWPIIPMPQKQAFHSIPIFQVWDVTSHSRKVEVKDRGWGNIGEKRSSTLWCH